VGGDAYKLEMLGKGDITKTVLTQNGDFRSSECIELLKEADIIVTNPPFSLFREYIPQLMEHNKKFLIVGPIGAVLYKYISKCIKDNELWLGKNRIKEFKQFDGSIKKFGNIHWFTNLEYDDKKAELNLTHEYSLGKYPKYDNYDAINVNRVAEIPKNYYGAVGVPITYLIKHNPDQFEIVKFMTGDDGKDLKVNGKRPYTRMIIRRISKK
jgi:methylase of polypeptide subunit release factors